MTTRPGTCAVKHRTWHTRAECEWPYACWITGNGQWALLAWCKHLTVRLYGTRAEAEAAKRLIDSDACGGRCHNDHRVVDLDWSHRKWVRR